MSTYSAVLLDMDGVVVDSEKYWQSQLAEILDNVTNTEVPLDRFTGRNPNEQYDLLCTEYEVQVSRAEYLELYGSYAESIYCERAELMSGFEDMMASIKRAGIPVGLVSSSPTEWITMVIDNFELTEIFDIALSGSDLNIPGKPNPDIYQRAANELNVSTISCIAVEDTQTGVEAAVSAGVYCIAYSGNRGGTEKFAAADEFVESADKLSTRLYKLLGIK